ncbi:RL14-like protein [Mya arenaria]|uniref:Large ribosomal subunit protein eL14 n=1 Tax=Mya arenaria TaxID=6604 RepID=A0ABY7EN47_MYAAR|nr:RL14-like protein [Mya arenaria]
MSCIPLPVSAACNYTGNESFIPLPVSAACNYAGNESFIPLPVSAACNYAGNESFIPLPVSAACNSAGNESFIPLPVSAACNSAGNESFIPLPVSAACNSAGNESFIPLPVSAACNYTGNESFIPLPVSAACNFTVEATDGHEVVGLQGRIVEATDGHEVVGLQGRIVEATDGHEVVGLQGRIVEATDGHEVVGLQGRISEGGTVYAETCGDPVPSTCPWPEQNEVGDGVERCVEIGRVAYIAYGDDKGKLCVVLDIIDQNRVLVEGPCTNVARKEFNMKAIQMTQFLLKIPHSCRQKVVRKAWEKEEITKKANLTDFDRFKLMKAKQCRNRIVNTEFGKLRKAAKKGAKK